MVFEVRTDILIFSNIAVSHKFIPVVDNEFYLRARNHTFIV